MITVTDLREHVLTAAEKYDLPLSVKQADTLTNHLAIYANRGQSRQVHLTDAEFGALVGLASGEDAKETGRRICRTEHTIKSHRRALYKKLGAKSGPHAVLLAIGLGLLHAPKPRTEADAR
ncbi:helix-turn-helix transcriptional regulator [Streptomyces sp. SID5910]|uniref:response regulator transcription factor n=1 Tax=Streptomyces sp. SID5910 TaxID=2690312 RepID=UPI0013691F43|nr:helix-turn-helix transcriptional regulator [Streptomyces sp. SID5910]MYR46754.1 hypothetical protein [Streptomyces sp. SID5910]